MWGTATSSILYAVKVRPDWRSVLPLVIGSSAGSALGASIARFLPKEVFTPIVLVALIVVGGFLGARTAISKGNSFVRKVFPAVVALLIVRLGYDVVLGLL